jgi:hypothetical protein
MQTAKKGYLYKIYYPRGVSWYRTINLDEIYSNLVGKRSEKIPQLFLEEFDKQAKKAWVWPLNKRDMK